jgi:DNA-binding NarL/FixJ family response regulator
VSVSVVVADDQTLLRSGLRGIVGSAPDLTVVGEAADGREAVDIVSRLRPDVVLMDIRMPHLDGLAATREITAATDTKVLVLTTFDLDDYVFGALRAGASGFLLKDTPPADLLSGIRIVAAGEALLAPTVTRRLIASFVTGSETGSRTLDPGLRTRITERELQVWTLIAQGLSNSEIAARLHIGSGTAKTHVAHLLTKLDARDRVQLVILAYRAGVANSTPPGWA